MVGVGTCDYRCIQSPEEGMRASGAGITDGCDLSNLSKVGNNLGSL